MRGYSCEFYFELVMIITKTTTTTTVHRRDCQGRFRSLWTDFIRERCNVGLVLHCHRSTSGPDSMEVDLDHTSRYSAGMSLVLVVVVVAVDVGVEQDTCTVDARCFLHPNSCRRHRRIAV